MMNGRGEARAEGAEGQSRPVVHAVYVGRIAGGEIGEPTRLRAVKIP